MTANDLFCIMIISPSSLKVLSSSLGHFSESKGSGQANLDWRQGWRRSSLSAMALMYPYRNFPQIYRNFPQNTKTSRKTNKRSLKFLSLRRSDVAYAGRRTILS